MELQPLVECDAHGAQMADVIRPTPPRGAVDLADRVERREVAQRRSLARHKCGQAFGLGGDAKDLFQRFGLELEDLVVTDQPLLVQTARSVALSRKVDPFCALDLLWPQVDHVAKSARRCVVRRRLVRQGRGLRAQWVEQDAGRTGLARPPREPAKVGEVADAPAVLRTKRVQLDRPAPCPPRRGPARIVRKFRSPATRRALGGCAHCGEDRLLDLRSRLDKVALPPVIGGQDSPPARLLGNVAQASARNGSGSNPARTSCHPARAFITAGSSRTSHDRCRSACSSTASTPIERGADIASPRASSARPTGSESSESGGRLDGGSTTAI